MKKTGKNEGTTLEQNLKHRIIERSTQLAFWDLSDEPQLTIPNMEDSVEQMIARKKAGLKERGFDSRGGRFYPIDPTSLTTAEKIVKKHKSELELKLKEQETFLKSEEQRRADLKKAQEAEKAAFDAFKTRQSEVKDSK